MITVIIPALNEQDTIEEVISLVKKSKLVSEIIVVDDKSVDETVAVSRKAGAKVITSTKLGKGTSMKDGVLVAENEIICFLDADITTYNTDIIELLCNPIIQDKADFSKAFFKRQAGRVTELVARPLLSILYPDFPNFIQPLSGMIAGKTAAFKKMEFEDGFGVDIGILIDMYSMGARIIEVDIGKIENRMHPLEQLGIMAKEVSRVIIKKSKKSNENNLENYEKIQVIREQMDFALKENLSNFRKVAIFDMDNTILRDSFIKSCAKTFQFEKQLLEIVTSNNNAIIRTKLIAHLLKGKSIGELLAVVDNMAVTDNLENLIHVLKQEDYIIGIISDSFDCITNHLKNKYGFDFSLANELEFSKSIATGELKIPSFFLTKSDSICKHDYCKLNGLVSYIKKQNLEIKNVVYIGDGENDICVMKHVGIGISFCSTNSLLDDIADFVIKKPDFNEIANLFPFRL